MLEDAVAVTVTLVMPCDVEVVAVSQLASVFTAAFTVLPAVKVVDAVPPCAR